jgi:D-tyrosyl-tRNA(Tyr) deacylase
MRAILQRVAWAEVQVQAAVVGKIDAGLLVYVGVAQNDTAAEADALARKIAHLRMFEDEHDKLNRSVQDVGGEILVVPNFTLQADARKGRRPSFGNAAGRDRAQPLQDRFIQTLQAEGASVSRGIFGADMTIRSAARGPINLVIDIPHEDA